MTGARILPLLAPAVVDEVIFVIPAVDQVSLEQAQDIALRITNYFETGKTDLNYQGLTGDDDGQGTSFGVIQWNFGQGTLGPLLKQMLVADGAAFANCFGPDADYATLQAAIQQGSVAAQLAWARKLLQNNRDAWKSAFMKIGSVDSFNAIQRQQAVSQYHALAVKVIANLRGVSPPLFAKVEVRSYAAIYDLCVQQNGVAPALGSIRSRVTSEQPSTQLDLMKIAVTERGLIAKPVYVADCISRRMGILTGSTFATTNNGTTAKRANPNFSLLAGVGAQFVAGL